MVKLAKQKLTYRFCGILIPKVSSSTSVVTAAFFFFSKSLEEEGPPTLRFLDLPAPASYQFGARSASVKVFS